MREDVEKERKGDFIFENLVLMLRSNNEILTNGVENIYPPVKQPLKLFCTRPFDGIYIGFDGSSILCCQDWKFEEVLGNINKQTLMEVWCGEKYGKKEGRVLIYLLKYYLV